MALGHWMTLIMERVLLFSIGRRPHLAGVLAALADAD